MPMATLELFVFHLKTAPYQTLQINRRWRYGFNSRLGIRPAFQFIGLDNDDITLSGSLYPELTGGQIIPDCSRSDGGKW